MSATNPFLNPGAGSNTISSSTSWVRVLNSERLSPTATADGTITPIAGDNLANVSVTSTALNGIVYASDGNYQYFLNAYPGDGPQPPKWNAAWLGDSNGCKCHGTNKPVLGIWNPV